MSGAHACIGRDDEPRLRDEHAFLDRQLGDAIALAEADDWQGFERKWEAFMIALEQHVQYEENQIFPTLAESGPAGKLATNRLRDEHAEIRREVTFLDGESQVPDLFIEQLRYLAQVLRIHKDREEQVLYPWLASLQPADSSSRIERIDPPDSVQPQENLWWGNPMRHEQEIARSNR